METKNEKKRNHSIILTLTFGEERTSYDMVTFSFWRFHDEAFHDKTRQRTPPGVDVKKIVKSKDMKLIQTIEMNQWISYESKKPMAVTFDSRFDDIN